MLLDALSPHGATAVILSGVCVLFIALIGIMFFFKQQRKQRLLAKYAADLEHQRQKHVVSNDGKAMYSVPPPPYTPAVTEKGKPLSSKPAPDRTAPADPALAERIARKSKMAAECGADKGNKATDTSLETPKMAELAPKPIVPPTYERQVSGGRPPARLWFSVEYDSSSENLLLHVQQASFSTARSAANVWVAVCVLTTNNDVHSTAATHTTTATHSPVFNSRIALQIPAPHLPHLLLRLTLHCGTDSTLGSAIVPLASVKNTTKSNTVIKDLH